MTIFFLNDLKKDEINNLFLDTISEYLTLHKKYIKHFTTSKREEIAEKLRKKVEECQTETDPVIKYQHIATEESYLEEELVPTIMHQRSS